MAEGGDHRPGITNDMRYQRLLLTGFQCRVTSRPSSALCKCTLVGSAGSDTEIPESDVDIMLERPDLIIDESTLEYRDDLPCYVRIPASGLPANIPTILLDDGKYMRADWMRDKYSELFGIVIETDGESKVGKTSSGSEGCDPTDFIPQVRISGIPRPAQSFVTRDRSWPSDDIISLICTGEFHLAARPAPCNPDETHDFCLSFAKAEVVLTRDMSANQVECIRDLKNVKRYIDNGRNVLTSYHMKTISLWYFEQASIDTWAKDRPVINILGKLDHYLDAGFMPHYFVPEMNLFAGIDPAHLVEIRSHLHSFLGLSVIAHDVTGISSNTRLHLALSMMEYVNTRSLGSHQSHHTENDSDKCLHTAEKLYIKMNSKLNADSHDADIVSMKTELSESLSRISPIPAIKEMYMKIIKEHQAKLNEVADLWVRSRKIHDTINCGGIPGWMRRVNDALDEPLDSVFRMDSTETSLSTERHEITASQQREHIMKKWMTFTFDIITRMSSHVNSLVGELLSVVSRESRFSVMRTDEYTNDIGRLILSMDHVSSELLSSATRAIEDIFPAMDSFTDPLTPPGTGDTIVNITMLQSAIEKLFIPVEYAIVRNIRPMSADVSRDQAAQLTLVQAPERQEYRCLASWFILGEAVVSFHNCHCYLHWLHGWQTFMAATIRSPAT